MIEIEEGDIKFTFPERRETGKYDDWAYYRNQFRSVAGGSKAVDILCLAEDAAWLVEAKQEKWLTLVTRWCLYDSPLQ